MANEFLMQIHRERSGIARVINVYVFMGVLIISDRIIAKYGQILLASVHNEKLVLVEGMVFFLSRMKKMTANFKLLSVVALILLNLLDHRQWLDNYECIV